LTLPLPPASPNPPSHWTGEAQVAVANYADAVISSVLRDDPSAHPELYRLCPESQSMARKLEAHRLENEAYFYLEHGNPAAMVAILRSNHPANDPDFDVPPWDRENWHGAVLPTADPVGTIRSTLAPRTYELIADFLEGRIRRTKEEGRPPATPDQRRAQTPVHDAKNWLPMIEAILSEAYPKQRYDHIHEQAIFIAARRHCISQKKFRNHLARPLSDRRRLPGDS